MQVIMILHVLSLEKKKLKIKMYFLLKTQKYLKYIVSKILKSNFKICIHLFTLKIIIQFV